MTTNKVFGIGFHKTGTTSVGRALEILGYRNCHGAKAIRSNMGELSMMEHLFKKDLRQIFEIAQDFDSFNDNPWFIIYRELDRQFPNSKFILTTRSVNHWMDSMVNSFKNYDTAFRLWIYGKPNPVANETIYQKRYLEHNEQVLEYFKYRKQDLLVLNIDDMDKWTSICNFLEKKIPLIEFPHLNKQHPN